MKDVKVLVTGVGAPGTKGTFYSLQNNYDNRKISIIGTDIRERVLGSFFVDKFHTVPRATQDNYLDKLLDICEHENVDVFLPQNTMELNILSANQKKFEDIGTKVIVSSEEDMEIANNKYLLLEQLKKHNLPTSQFFKASTWNELESALEKLGYPENPVVIKPVLSNGSRGVRIIHPNINLKKRFYNEKPSDLMINLEILRMILGEEFAELIVMEYLPGEEYTVDLFRGEELVVIPRVRSVIRSGITFEGITEKNEEIIEQCNDIAKILDLQYIYGYQFKKNREGVPMLIESNPRVQGTMVMATLSGANIIYSAVKRALDEPIPEFNISWGLRFVRYWGGIGIIGDSYVDI